MVRPKKAAAASRANGGRAANKGKVVNGKEELFGAYDTDGTYVVKKIIVKRELAKGEVQLHKRGCEHDVYTFCLYYGEFKTVNDGNEPTGKTKTYGKGGPSVAGWDAAQKKKKRLRCTQRVRSFERTCEDSQAAQSSEGRGCAYQI